MTSILIFISGAVLLIFSAEKLVGYLIGVAKGLRVSLFLLAIIFTGIEFDDIFLGVAVNMEDEKGVALGIVFGTALSLPGIVLALAAIITPTKVSIPRDYIILFAVSPLVMVFFILKAPLTAIDGIVLIALFVAFIAYIAVRESKRATPVFRNAEIYENYASVGVGGRETPGSRDLPRRLPPAEPASGAEPADGQDLARQMPFGGAREHSGWVGLGLAILSLGGLIVGAATTGIGTKGILQTYGLEGTVFGATIATLVLTIEDIFLTVEPTRKGAPEIGVGNVIGSVVFSVTGKLGIVLLAGSLVVGPDVLTWHLPALCVLTWLAAYFMSTGRLRRWHGFVLLGLYLVYWTVSFFAMGFVPADLS